MTFSEFVAEQKTENSCDLIVFSGKKSVSVISAWRLLRCFSRFIKKTNKKQLQTLIKGISHSHNRIHISKGRVRSVLHVVLKCPACKQCLLYESVPGAVVIKSLKAA